MKALRDLGFGLFSAVLSSLLVIGAISLSIVEGLVLSPPPVVTQPTDHLRPSSQFTPSETQLVATFTAVIPTTCPPPAGWRTYYIQPGDTLAQLAAENQISAAVLMEANCLVSEELPSETFIYLPPPAAPETSAWLTQPADVAVPSPTHTRLAATQAQPIFPTVACGPPPGWVRTTVQPQDTLFRLSLTYGVSVSQLQAANCMGSSVTLYAGQSLFVPFLIFPTSTRTVTAAPTLTLTPTRTPTTVPSATSTFTETVVPSSTPTFTTVPATATPTATETETPVPTETNIPEGG